MKLIISFLLFLTSTAAFAMVNISVDGGISMASQSVNSSLVSPSIKSFASYGLLVNLMLPTSSFGLTAGVLYTEMGTHIDSGISKVDEKAPYYQIPITLDYWFANTLAVGAGFYYGAPGGNIVDSGATGIYTNSSSSFSQANYASSDYGAIIHGALKIPVSPKFFVGANIFYEWGLQNVSTISTLTVHNNSFLVLAGIGVSI